MPPLNEFLEFMQGYPPLLKVSTEAAQSSTSYPLKTAVKLRDTTEEGYMASFAVFHQLHCLNYIRKFVHFDYYNETEWAQAPLLRQHAGKT